MRSLNEMRRLRAWIITLRNRWLSLSRGIRIHPTSSVSLSAQFVAGKRGAIQVGEYTQIAFKSLIIARTPDGEVQPVRIGSRCFIGGGAIILPGVTIGNNSVVGAGAVVFEDTLPGTIVAGNPARVVRENVEIMAYGRIRDRIVAPRPVTGSAGGAQ